MTNFKFKCTIDAGWASLCFSNGEKKEEIFFSHLFDGLDKIMDAVLALNEGRKYVETHLFADTEAFAFGFELENGNLFIRLFNFHEWTENQPLKNIEHRGLLVLETECPLGDFSRQVMKLFQALKQSYGEAGYAEKWGNPFPSEKLEMLKSVILRRRMNFLTMFLL